MKFLPAAPNEQLSHRLVSEQGKWNLGFHRVLYGWRLQLYREGNGWNTLDLCCGMDLMLMFHSLLHVRVILGLYDEDVTERQIQDEFPIPSCCKPLTSQELRDRLEEGFNRALSKLSEKAGVDSESLTLKNVPLSQSTNTQKQ